MVGNRMTTLKFSAKQEFSLEIYHHWYVQACLKDYRSLLPPEPVHKFTALITEKYFLSVSIKSASLYLPMWGISSAL